MKSLYNILKESLLGGFDEIESSADPKKEIEKFIKDNYNIRGRIQISDGPNENGKYEVSCGSDIYIKNQKLTSLTNKMFEWGEVSREFDCSYCELLTSLKGAPKKVGKDFDCSGCESLKTLEGVPEKVGGHFYCRDCKSLTSLEGAPKEVGGDFDCRDCDSLKNLEGAPKEVGGDFDCRDCDSLKNLEGAPKKVGGDFYCIYCKSLTSLEGIPKEVGGSLSYWGCGKEFTDKDLKK